jgi:hypothetical protein
VAQEVGEAVDLGHFDLGRSFSRSERIVLFVSQRYRIKNSMAKASSEDSRSTCLPLVQLVLPFTEVLEPE